MSDIDKSLDEILANVERALDQIAPKDHSLWQVVQLSRDWIKKKRQEGVKWAQIAAVFRAVGFPTATEANVSAAYRKPPTKKARKARDALASTKERAKAPEVTLPNPRSTPAPTPSGSGPRLLKPRY